MTEQAGPRKIATYTEVSAAALADGGFLVPELLQPALGGIGDHTDNRAGNAVKREALRAAAAARHAKARASANAVLVPVLDHHGPVVHEWETYQAACEGCDAAGWEVDETPWPCSSWLLISGQDA